MQAMIKLVLDSKVLRATLLLLLLNFVSPVAWASDQPFVGIFPSVNAYLDYHSVEVVDREALLHPLFVLNRSAANGKRNEIPRAELLATPAIVPYRGNAVSMERISANAMGVSLHYANDERAWLMLASDGMHETIIFALHVNPGVVEDDGLFDSGNNTDLVREIVGKFYLHVASGNLKPLHGLLATGWAEVYLEESESQWRKRDRGEYLAYVANRDGITRIAAGKKIDALEFMRRDLVRVTVLTETNRREQLFLVADDDSWQVAFYLH